MVRILTASGTHTPADNSRQSFLTYHHYLQAISLHIDGKYGVDDDLYINLNQELCSIGAFSRLKLRPCNVLSIEKILRNAWATEVVIERSADSPSVEVVSCASLWATVQLYYAVYHSARAFCLATGWVTPQDTHSRMLSDLSAIVARRNFFPEPWNAWCSGHPNSPVYGGSAQTPSVPTISALASPKVSDCPEWMAMILRTTRERDFSRVKENWRRKNKTALGKPYQIVPAKHQTALAANYWQTTLFDFLYRLRARSNYNDADAFISGMGDGDDPFHFNVHLTRILRSTLFLFESAICKTLGNKSFSSLAGRFTNTVGPSIGLANRIPYLQYR